MGDQKSALSTFMSLRIATAPFIIQHMALFMDMMVVPYSALRAFAVLIHAEVKPHEVGFVAGEPRFQFSLETTLKANVKEGLIRFQVELLFDEPANSRMVTFELAHNITPPTLTLVDQNDDVAKSLVGKLSALLTYVWGSCRIYMRQVRGRMANKTAS